MNKVGQYGTTSGNKYSTTLFLQNNKRHYCLANEVKCSQHFYHQHHQHIRLPHKGRQPYFSTCNVSQQSSLYSSFIMTSSGPQCFIAFTSTLKYHLSLKQVASHDSLKAKIVDERSRWGPLTTRKGRVKVITERWVGQRLLSINDYQDKTLKTLRKQLASASRPWDNWLF